jgi:hypothetical protein
MRTVFSILILALSTPAFSQTVRKVRTIGVDYFGAKSNCEVILNGDARNCQPAGSMWYCDCYIQSSVVIAEESLNHSHWDKVVGEDFIQPDCPN